MLLMTILDLDQLQEFFRDHKFVARIVVFMTAIGIFFILYKVVEVMVSKQIIEVLEYLCEKIGVTIDWGSDNIMPKIEDFIGRFVTYITGRNILYLVIILCNIIISYIVCMKLKLVSRIIAALNESSCEDDEFHVWNLIIFVVILIICLLVGADVVMNIIEVITIPEKTLYDSIMSIINSKSS